MCRARTRRQAPAGRGWGRGVTLAPRSPRPAAQVDGGPTSVPVSYLLGSGSRRGRNRRGVGFGPFPAAKFGLGTGVLLVHDVGLTLLVVEHGALHLVGEGIVAGREHAGHAAVLPDPRTTQPRGVRQKVRDAS